jgi:hypothetical protein
VEEPPPTQPGQILQTDPLAPRQAGNQGQPGIERLQRGALSPVDAATARRNRRWMALVLAPSLLVGAIALILTVAASSKGPSVHPIDVPAGYHAVSGDGYFAYSVPSSWSQSAAYTDNVGDLSYSGQSGWVAEHLDARATRPEPEETPPRSLAAFGEPQPTPYHLGSAAPTQVKGATAAYRFTMTRPGGFEATAIDAWQASSGAEIWLVIRADPATTAAVIASLQA